MAEELLPPDYKQCQAETRKHSPFALGPSMWTRCERPPVWLCEETEPSGDGKMGSMTVCEDCRKVMEDSIPTETIRFTRIATDTAGAE